MIQTLEKAEMSLYTVGAIHSTKISRNFGPKLNGSVRSNRKSFEKTGPPFEVVLFSRSDRSECWLNGSRPVCQVTRRSSRFVDFRCLMRSQLRLLHFRKFFKFLYFDLKNLSLSKYDRNLVRACFLRVSKLMISS